MEIIDKLFKELNKQFKKYDISRIDQGAIVDVSIVIVMVRRLPMAVSSFEVAYDRGSLL